MMFLSRTQVITALGAVLLALYVLDLVRRRKLSEEYSLLWVMGSGMPSSPELIRWLLIRLGFCMKKSAVPIRMVAP